MSLIYTWRIKPYTCSIFINLLCFMVKMVVIAKIKHIPIAMCSKYSCIYLPDTLNPVKHIFTTINCITIGTIILQQKTLNLGVRLSKLVAVQYSKHETMYKRYVATFQNTIDQVVESTSKVYVEQVVSQHFLTRWVKAFVRKGFQVTSRHLYIFTQKQKR